MIISTQQTDGCLFEYVHTGTMQDIPFHSVGVIYVYRVHFLSEAAYLRESSLQDNEESLIQTEYQAVVRDIYLSDIPTRTW